ncbi:hypothetical protein ACHAWF_012521 [Thalassiosira exigua]
MDNRMVLLLAASKRDFSMSSSIRLLSDRFLASTARTSASTRHREQKKGPAQTKANCDISPNRGGGPVETKAR